MTSVLETLTCAKHKKTKENLFRCSKPFVSLRSHNTDRSLNISKLPGDTASWAEGQLRSNTAGGLERKSQKQQVSPYLLWAHVELKLLLLLLVPAQAAASAILQACLCLALCLTHPDQDFGPLAGFHDLPCEAGDVGLCLWTWLCPCPRALDRLGVCSGLQWPCKCLTIVELCLTPVTIVGCVGPFQPALLRADG